MSFPALFQFGELQTQAYARCLLLPKQLLSTSLPGHVQTQDLLLLYTTCGIILQAQV